MPKAMIVGCSGPVLSVAERRFMAASDPFGFILFARNCQDPAQVRALVRSLRGAVGRQDAPVLIDQEGGRVQRLKPPHWRAAPAAATIAGIYARDRASGMAAARLNAALIGIELMHLGIDVDCLPCLDLRLPEGHGVIGDRAFGSDPETVAALGRAVCEGLMEAGVMPVIKHIPGHGRAAVDSHHDLPVVATSRSELERSDFAPFRALADMPLAMTAHVVYTAIDAEAPATLSETVIRSVIRQHIGFAGLLMSDDVSMQALSGDIASRSRGALQAGCDLVLHCNGRMDEMEQVAAACGDMTAEQSTRWQAARTVVDSARRSFDAEGALDNLTALLSGADRGTP